MRCISAFLESSCFGASYCVAKNIDIRCHFGSKLALLGDFGQRVLAFPGRVSRRTFTIIISVFLLRSLPRRWSCRAKGRTCRHRSLLVAQAHRHSGSRSAAATKSLTQSPRVAASISQQGHLTRWRGAFCLRIALAHARILLAGSAFFAVQIACVRRCSTL